MAIFWRLVFAHFLADFTLQPNYINAWKKKSIWGMLVHCGINAGVKIALTYPFLGEFWVKTEHFQLRGWTCVLILFILHFLEDQWRVYTIRRFGTPDNSIYFVWDQLIHFAAIFLFFPVAMGVEGVGTWIPEKWPVIGCLLVVVTHFCTVLIYYFEKDIFEGGYPSFDEKYISMAERVILALFFLLPGWWWLILAAVWVEFMYYVRKRRILDFSWFGFGIGMAVSVVGGMLARMIVSL